MPISPFISVTRSARRRPAPSVIAVLLATTVLLASFALPAFGLSPAKLLSRALSTARSADKDAKKAEKDAKAANANALSSAVGTTRLQNGGVTAEKIAAGAVGNGQLAGNAVGAGNIMPGSVGSAALAARSVGNSQIVLASVSIADLSGANTNATFDIPEVTANTCGTFEVADAAAATSDFPMISFPGPTNLPLQLSATVLRVDTAGSVRVKLCNGTGVNANAVSGVNIEVVTLR